MPHHRAKRVLAIVAITTTFIGCSSEPPPASTPTMQGEVIRLFSTPATFPLLVELSTAYAETHTHITFEIQQTTSSESLNTRSYSESYVLTHHIPGDMQGWAAPIGYDALAIVTHPDLQISSISLAQLRSIFQGQVQNWSQIGSDVGESVRVINREEESDSLLEFQRLVMGRRPISANATVVSSDSQMLDMLMNTGGAIGYVMYSQLMPGVNLIGIGDVMPSFDTMQTQSYPLRTTLYMVGVQQPSDEYQAFFDWIQGIEGQRIVSAKYIPLHTPS